MSRSICSRCLSRSHFTLETSASSPLPLNTAQRAAFSTTSALAANPPKKKGPVTAKPASRQGKTLRLNKNVRESTGKPPAQAERKAFRKKIVLSNTNALEVQGLQDLNLENSSTEKLAQLEGQVLALTDAQVSALRTLDVFKPTQAWNLFRKPATVIRKETVEIAKALESAQGGENANAKQVVKRILFGEKGSGKTVLQLQAMALALNKGWVVLHFPNGMFASSRSIFGGVANMVAQAKISPTTRLPTTQTTAASYTFSLNTPRICLRPLQAPIRRSSAGCSSA